MDKVSLVTAAEYVHEKSLDDGHAAFEEIHGGNVLVAEMNISRRHTGSKEKVYLEDDGDFADIYLTGNSPPQQLVAPDTEEQFLLDVFESATGPVGYVVKRGWDLGKNTKVEVGIYRPGENGGEFQIEWHAGDIAQIIAPNGVELHMYEYCAPNAFTQVTDDGRTYGERYVATLSETELPPEFIAARDNLQKKLELEANLMRELKES